MAQLWGVEYTPKYYRRQVDREDRRSSGKPVVVRRRREPPRAGHEGPLRSPQVPDEIIELAYRICTAAWQQAVAWHLAGALDDIAWAKIKRRPDRLCADLAALANEVERISKLVGEVAGLACAEDLRALGQPRIVQQIAQTIVEHAVPKFGEQLTTVLARQLRIIGIWICLPADRSLRACPCFVDLVSGHTKDWVEERLAAALSELRSEAVRTVAPPS